MKTDRIAVRLTLDQKVKLRQAADRVGLTLSGFVMAATDAALTRPPFLTREDLCKLDQHREQLRRAGMNLNTLLRDLQAFNVGSIRRPPSDEQFQAVSAELRVALRPIGAWLKTKV